MSRHGGGWCLRAPGETGAQGPTLILREPLPERTESTFDPNYEGRLHFKRGPYLGVKVSLEVWVVPGTTPVTLGLVGKGRKDDGEGRKDDGGEGSVGEVGSSQDRWGVGWGEVDGGSICIGGTARTVFV